MHGAMEHPRLASLNHTREVLKNMQALGRPSMSGELSKVRVQIAEMLQHLQRLDYLREIAAGVVQFYGKALDVDAGAASAEWLLLNHAESMTLHAAVSTFHALASR